MRVDFDQETWESVRERIETDLKKRNFYWKENPIEGKVVGNRLVTLEWKETQTNALKRAKQ